MNFETVFFNNGHEHFSSEDPGIVRMLKNGMTLFQCQSESET